jgi:hypothetical protein
MKRQLVVASALILSCTTLLAGCGLVQGTSVGDALYLPIEGATRTQSATAAYWDCNWQNVGREAQDDPAAFVPPLGVGAGVAEAVAEAQEGMRLCAIAWRRTATSRSRASHHDFQ